MQKDNNDCSFAIRRLRGLTKVVLGIFYEFFKFILIIEIVEVSFESETQPAVDICKSKILIVVFQPSVCLLEQFHLSAGQIKANSNLLVFFLAL